MYKGLSVCVVVPAYNEELHVAQVIRTTPAFVDHIIVVDDRSTDGTSREAHRAADTRTEVVRHEENLGVGGAILTGHRRALDLAADVSVVMAGDAQMDPDYLPQLLDPIVEGGYGFAKANRFFSSQSYSGMPRIRIIGNIVLSFMTKFASGYWHLFDPQNGYTAVRTDVLRRLDLDSIAQRYEFENDLLINLSIADVPAVDVPIPAVYAEEQSGIKLRRVIPAISFLLVRGFFRRVMQKYVIRSFSPIALLLFSGLLLMLWSVVFGIWVLVQTLGPDEASTGTVLLCVAPFLVAVQLLLNAMVLDIQEAPDRRR
jgi:glycosyltransferase involved in cell wall biosynthesis